VEILEDKSDLRIFLTDGSTVDIDLAGSETIQDIIDAIMQQADKLTVTLNSEGNGLKITDASGGSGNLEVLALSGSDAADDLGILGSGMGDTIDGKPFVPLAGDIRVHLSDGTKVDIDLSGAETIQHVLNAITNAHENLSAELNAAVTGIDLSDTSGGTRPTSVMSLNGTTAADDLGLSGGVGSSTGLQGQALVAGRVVLDGAGGADTLTGTSGDDRLTGGTGADVIDGGNGSDTLVESRSTQSDFTLTDTALTIGSEGTDTLSSIEKAILTGSSFAETIDASGFSGPVTLASGGGIDTLRGGDGNDLFRVDVSNLTAGDKVTVAPGGGDANEAVVLGSGSSVQVSDLDWITLDPAAANIQYTIERPDLLELDSLNLIAPEGWDLVFRAKTLNIFGTTIRTDHATEAGDITLEGEHITIDDNAAGQQSVLSAVTTSGITPDGAINIIAKDLFKDFTAFGFANVDYNTADITIGNALITGGDVTVRATAEAKDFDIDFGETWIGDKLAWAANKILGGLEGLSLIGAVSVATARATVNIGEYATIVADDFIAHSIADLSVEAKPSGSFAGVAVGVGISDSTVTISGNITTEGDLTVRASGNHTLKVEAEAGKPGEEKKKDDISGEIKRKEKTKGFDAGVAVSVLVSDVAAHVTDKATLTVGDDLFIRADSTDTNETKVKAETGKEGKLALAAAVSVEHGNTFAYLDGVADVAGNISVAALQNKGDGGVEAEASVGDTDPDWHDFEGQLNKYVKGKIKPHQDKLEDKVTNKIDEKLPVIKKTVDKVKTKSLEFLKKNETIKKLIESPTTNKFDFGAAVAVSVDINNAAARIGDGVITDGSRAADVEADGSVSIHAKTENRPGLKTESGAENQTDVKDPAQKNAAFGGSVAVGVNIILDDAQAYISGDAAVDAKNTLTVKAESLNQIDPLGLWGTNLVAPFLAKNTNPTHTTDSQGPTTVNLGDTVLVTDKHTGEGDVGSWYEYTGSAPQVDIDLTSEDFKNTDNWKDLGNPALRTGKKFIDTLRTYLKGNLGLDENLPDNWSRATVDGQKLALAGAFNVMVVDHNAQALIKDGARINQEPGFHTVNSDVVVEAASVNHAINLIGNLDLPDPGDIKKGQIFEGAAGSKAADEGSAAGSSLGFYWYDNKVTAKIEKNVELYADSLEVDADNETLSVLVLASGGQADNVAFNGAFGANVVNDSTLAQIENGAVINVGSGAVADSDAGNDSVFIDATDTSNLITVAGGVTSSKHVGVGASLGVNVSLRDTQALLGDGTGEAASAGSLVTGGDVLISARNDGFIGSFAVSGAVTSAGTSEDTTGGDSNDPGITPHSGTGGTQGSDGSQQSDSDLLNWQKKMTDVLKEMKDSGKVTDNASAVKDATEQVDKNINKAKSGYAISGAFTVNFVHDDAQAYIRNITRLEADDLTLDAEDGTIVASVAGSVAFTTADQDKTAVGIAGGAGINVVTGATAAFIDGAELQVNSLAMQADRTSWIASLSAGAGGAKGKKGYGIGGSLAFTHSQTSTETALRNATGGVKGTILLQAHDDTNIVLVAGAGGFGGRAGVGAAIAFSDISNRIVSRVENVSDFTHSGNVDIKALSDGMIISVVGAVGVGTGGGGEKGYGVGGTIAVNFINNSVDAGIIDSATTARPSSAWPAASPMAKPPGWESVLPLTCWIMKLYPGSKAAPW
jgi:hypothetical protein